MGRAFREIRRLNEARHPGGGSVARAKRTDRAEARRRYRATTAPQETLEEDLEGDDSSPAATPAAGASRSRGATAGRPTSPTPRPSTRPADAPPQRPGITAAFRGAVRPVDVRSDLLYLQTHTTRMPDARAVWLPSLTAIGSGVFVLASQPLRPRGIASILVQL